MPSYLPTASSVVCTVEGASVGSEACGMWMVREALSKFWPRDWFRFCSISACRALSVPALEPCAS